MSSLVNSTKFSMENLYQFSTISFRIKKQRKYFPNHLYFPNIGSVSHWYKIRQRHSEKKLLTNISSTKDLMIKSNNVLKICIPRPMEFISDMQVWANIWKTINVIHHINKEMSQWQCQQLQKTHVTKSNNHYWYTHGKLGTEENIPNMTESISQNPVATPHSVVRKIKVSHWDQQQGKNVLFHLSFSTFYWQTY